MTNFKSGDKVELNCSVPSFCESVGKGLEIYDNCFIDDVATIKKMQPDGVGFWLERLDVNNNGANGIRGNEVGLLRMAAQPKPKKAVPFLQTGESFEHTKTLNFILERMINVHGEHESVDYIHKLRNAIIFTEEIEGSVNTVVECSKPKKTRVEFVRCNGSIFDLKEDFESGKLYCQDEETEDYCVCGYGERNLIDDFIHGNIFRKVETEITWQEELEHYISTCSQIDGLSEISNAYYEGIPEHKIENEAWDNEFIEMCRVVIAAVDGK